MPKNSQIWNEATAEFRTSLRRLRADALKALNEAASWTDALKGVKRNNALFAEKKVAETANLEAVVARIDEKRAAAERARAKRAEAFVAKMKANCKFTSTPWAFVLANTTERQRDVLCGDSYFAALRASAEEAQKTQAEKKKRDEASRASAEEAQKTAILEREIAKKNLERAKRATAKAGK